MGREILICCPFHEDRKPSCSVNLETGIWICYTGCGSGDWIDFIEKIKRDPEYAPIETVQQKDTNQTPILASWLERGFTREILANWEIEWDSSRGAMSLPIKDRAGRPFSRIWRFPKGVEPKYRYEAGFKRSEILYGLWRLPTRIPEVFLVEGPLDAIWIYEMACRPALAILGSSLSVEQAKLIKDLQPHKVILCFDNDAAGRHADHEATKLLRQQGCWVYRVKLPPKFKDIQEVPSCKVPEVLSSPELCVNGKGILHSRYRRWQPNSLNLSSSVWKA